MQSALNTLEHIDSVIGDTVNNIWYGTFCRTFESYLAALKASDKIINIAGVIAIRDQIDLLNKTYDLKDQYSFAINQYSISRDIYRKLLARKNAGENVLVELNQASLSIHSAQKNMDDVERRIRVYFSMFKTLRGYTPSRLNNEYNIYKIDISRTESEVIGGLNKVLTEVENVKSSLLNSKYDSVVLTSMLNDVRRNFNIGNVRNIVIRNIEHLINNIKIQIRKVENHLDNITTFENGETVEIVLNEIKTEEKEVIKEEKNEEYVVKKGDTLIAIASKYKMDYRVIYEANKEKIPDGDPRKLRIGTNLVIPGVTTTITNTVITKSPVKQETISNEKLEEITPVTSITPLKDFDDIKSNWAIDIDTVVEGEFSNTMPLDKDGYMIDKNGNRMFITQGMGDIHNNGVYKNIDNYKPSHIGTDFSGGGNDTGTKISPIGDGVVIYTQESKYSYGNCVRVLHEVVDEKGNTSYVVSLYAHLNEVNVKPGDVIDSSTVLGTLGNTGNSTGAHLHLEVAKVDLTEEQMRGKNAEEVLATVKSEGLERGQYGNNYYDMGSYYVSNNTSLGVRR